MSPRVSEVCFVPADDELRASGMQGWCTFVLDDQFKVEGIAVRKTTLGRLALSFPFRQDSFGRRWRYLHPITDQARRSVENQVLALLDLNREFTQ